MAMISIPEAAFQQLNRLAAQENRSPQEIIVELLETYSLTSATPNALPTSNDPQPYPQGTLARLAYEAQKVALHLPSDDLADTSRTVLETNFADYLLNRGTE